MKGLSAFGGLRITQCPLAAKRFPDLCKVRLFRVDRLLLDPPGQIGSGGNSGFQALNLALQFGARRIILVGYDLRVDKGVHWHGPHPRGFNNPAASNCARWRKILDDQAPLLEAIGVDVINASAVSSLTAFRKLPLRQALQLGTKGAA